MRGLAAVDGGAAGRQGGAGRQDDGVATVETTTMWQPVTLLLSLTGNNQVITGT